MKTLLSILFLFVYCCSASSQESSSSEKTIKKKVDTTSAKVKQEKKNDVIFTDEDSVSKKEMKKNPISFSKDVFPLLKKHCMPCHSEEEENPSELYFESFETMMNGGKNGSPLVVGKGDTSMLVNKLRPKPKFGDQMPLPKRKLKLSEEVIQIFVDWINQGANKN